MSYKEEIIKLNASRYAIIHKKNASWDKEAGRYSYDTLLDEANIDKYSDKIMEFIKLGFEKLEFEFIFEQLSNLGQAPNLLYDDNGHWAVTSDGYQNVVTGDEPEDVTTHFIVEAKDWRDTPRKALEHYLFDDEE